MRERAEVLRELISAARPVDLLVRELAEFGWDSEREIEVLRPCHLIAVLNDFIAGRRTASEVQSWAEAIECRDDIGLDAESKDVLKDAVFELANPEITRALSPLLAQKILARLSS